MADFGIDFSASTGFDASSFYTGADYGYGGGSSWGLDTTNWTFDSGSSSGSNSSIWGDAANVIKAGAGFLSETAKSVTPWIGLNASIQQAGAQRAAGYYQAGLYQAQAYDTLYLAGVRADQEERIASLQAGRRIKQAEIQSQNYQIQANNILRVLERSNATARARAAANGIDINSGSPVSVQNLSTKTAMFDVGVADYNALMAKVLGFEDASAMLIAGRQQAKLTREAADRQAKQLNLAADYAVKSGGLLSNVSLAEGAGRFLTTI